MLSCPNLDLISERCRLADFGRPRGEDAIGYAKFYSRSRHVVIRLFDEAGNIVETEEHAGNFRER
jgi:hypothetical protein